MKEQRRTVIKRWVQEQGELTVKQMKERFSSCCEMTLRRDLQALEEAGILKRTHGGAIALSRVSGQGEDVYSLKAISNMEAKMCIAKKAVCLMETGRSVYIDSGTTLMCFASALPDETIVVLTSGPNIALELLKKNKPMVNMLGGALSRTTLSVSGDLSLAGIGHMNIDIAFMGASAFSLENGFTGGIAAEAELKRAVMQKARKRVLLMDSSKIDKNLPFTFAGLKDIDIWVTDGNLPKEIIAKAKAQGVEVL